MRLVDNLLPAHSVHHMHPPPSKNLLTLETYRDCSFAVCCLGVIWQTTSRIFEAKLLQGNIYASQFVCPQSGTWPPGSRQVLLGCKGWDGVRNGLFEKECRIGVGAPPDRCNETISINLAQTQSCTTYDQPSQAKVVLMPTEDRTRHLEHDDVSQRRCLCYTDKQMAKNVLSFGSIIARLSLLYLRQSRPPYADVEAPP